ncbi:DUF4402 domain-containing protein [Salegentibacter sp. F188]|uniref:DUF4402 domain-containing protein n=1 Tax=Autumnicola patrickiae TaxID=3075591 RepID=A0ABU3E2C4_9FLAO|nr:DUF4402 domain-containing protein [Salegentibacter sp. F188]MDT0690127.1 DUF4402 domain-containing protein [Salegentibacter sp. F188]
MRFSDLYFRFFVFALVIISATNAGAQENPPIPITVEVNTSQFLNFGSFTAGPGVGTVTVDHSGVRTPTGDVVLLNMGESPSAALFDVTANPGTIIQINAPTNITLTGSNGGEIYLDINSFSTGNPFITSANPPSTNAVFVGGTLNIPANAVNLSGRYSGTFTLTFNHQ